VAPENRRAIRLGLAHGAGVSDPRVISNIALVGFMGCGKSTVGRQVAGELGFEFVDTDRLVVDRAGLPIAEIFAIEGEAAFRELEREVISELGTRKGLVIATGGGAIVDPENLASLKAHALVICLWAGAETLHQRTKHQSHRPLLQKADPLGAIRELLAERESIYKQADVMVNTEQRPQRAVAAQVRHQFEESSSGGTV
jgi:shikimate kinase